MAASITALPPLTCTARGRQHRQLFVCCAVGQLWAACFCEACAGRRIRWLCPPAVACSAGFCLPASLCLPCPLPSSVLAPVHFCFAPVHFTFASSAPVPFPCAPGSSCRLLHQFVVRASSLFQPTCLQAARLPRRQQQRGSAVAARAPCSVRCTVAGAARLPLGSRHMETAFGQPMRRCRYP